MNIPHPLQGLIEPQFVEITAIGKGDAFYRDAHRLIGKKAMFITQAFPHINDGSARDIEDNFFRGYLDITEFPDDPGLFSSQELEDGWVYFVQIGIKPAQKEPAANQVTFTFSADRKDHMVNCACGEEHEIVHKIIWNELLGLVLVNFWVCMAAGKTFYITNEGVISEKNFRLPVPTRSINFDNPFFDIEKWTIKQKRGALSSPKLDPALRKRLEANSGNWQKMMDILTEEAMMSEDEAKLYPIVNNHTDEEEDETDE